ncbi:MAG: type I glutamate--ammonia ligase, partial [Nitrososphaerales archaeon]
SNRSAAVRIPVYEKGSKSAAKKRIEYRPPDPSANPYLCFAALLAAGIDGIKKKLEIGDPLDENIYKLTPERRRELGVRELPGNLKEAVEALKSDSGFLKPIFPEEAIERIIEIELKEYFEVSMRPHPHEFYLYFDI